MATFHIQMAAQKQYSLPELEQSLRANRNFEFCTRTEQTFDDAAVLLLVFEQIFIRASGTISLTVLLTEKGDQQTADLIATGGREGLSYSFGACRSFVREAAAILEPLGFSALNPEPEKKLHQKVLDYLFD